jgi:predicted GNAT superfamily acetyltransferase
MIAQCSSYFGRLTGIEGLDYDRVVAAEWWPNASLRAAGLRNNRCLTQALNSGLARQDRDQCHLNRASECQEKGLKG